MMTPINERENDFFKTSVYEFNGYKVSVRCIDNEKLITFKAVDSIAFQPRIIFSNGEGVIDCSGIAFMPENAEKVIKYIRDAGEAIKTVKEHLL